MPSWRGHGQLYLSSCGAEIVELVNRIGYWIGDSGIFIHPVVIIKRDKKLLFTIKIFIIYIYIYTLPKLLRRINATLSVLNRKTISFSMKAWF